MHQILQLLIRHGYLVLFAAVLAEQMGVPIPSVPALLAMGALAGTGRFSFAAALLLAGVASLLGDIVWYELGRRRGHSILNLLCRISLEPDSCVRRTENVFTRDGPRSLLFAKFVPGLSTVAPPMAGMIRMSRRKFLLWDSAGGLIWAGAYMGAGLLFRAQLERVGELAARMGLSLGIVVVTALAAWLGSKYVLRRRFLRQLRIDRVTPEWLMEKLKAGEPVTIVDLRNPAAAEASGFKLPGALSLRLEELEARAEEMALYREVVLYCS